MSKKKKIQRNFAVLAFASAFIFFGAEVFGVCTAKNIYDHNRAKTTAEELSVELSLVSSALNTGNKKLYNESLSRYRVTLAEFSRNEYMHYAQAGLLNKLRDYSNLLRDSSEEIDIFLELSAALASVHSELQLADAEELDIANFYRIQETFRHLREALDKIKSEELKDVKGKLDSFAQEIMSLSESSAICISVCPKSSFEEKQKKIQEIKARYEKDFNNIGLDASKDYNPSELILMLAEI